MKELSGASGGDLLSAVSLVHRTGRRAVRQAWAREPLPPAQSELLRLAAGRPGITVADAAQELRLAPNTVSTLVGKLTSAGLLTRNRGSLDARTALLTITDSARERLAQWRDLRTELASQALARLGPADRKVLAAALPALLRLAQELETSDRAA